MSEERLPEVRQDNLPAVGLHPGVAFSEYLRWDAASSSLLRVLRDTGSPAKMRYAMLHPSSLDTEATRIGTAGHAAILQPDIFESDFIARPAFSGKGMKARKEAWEVENDGMTVLSKKEYATAVAVRDAVMMHPRASRMMEGPCEVSMAWKDPNHGVLVKGRPDMLSSRTSAVVDLKVVLDASRYGFGKSMWDFGYYMQAWMYLAGLAELGEPREAFWIVAVEKRPPYEVATRKVDDDTLQAGSDHFNLLLEKYAKCLNSDEWPGYQVETIRMYEPGLRRVQDDVEMETMR